MTSRGEARALLTNDISSPHLSVGVRVSCMGTGNHWHEYHGYNGHYGNDGHHNRHEHHGKQKNSLYDYR
jgi:hypothetical protein